VTLPAATESWTPIAHHEFLAQVEASLGGAGIQVVNQAHGLSRDGARYFGLLQVSRRSEDPQVAEFEEGKWHSYESLQAQSEYGYVVGLRNSHDKSYPASLVVGSSVFVCDNLSFSGEIKISRKHTTFISRDLPGLTVRAIGKLSDAWGNQDKRFDAYKQFELSTPKVHDLLIRALDSRAVTCQQIPHVLREWRAPRHPEFATCGNTAWRLFNAVTEVAKESGLWQLPARTTALHGLFDQEVGLLDNIKDQNPALN
jgi:hypothetical protein